MGFQPSGLLTVLNLIELIARFAPRRQRKGAKVIQELPTESDGFGVDHALRQSMHKIL